MSELKKLRSEIEEKEAERNQAKGAMASIEKQWKDEHGLESQEEVEARIDKLNKSIKKLKVQYEEKLDSVKEKIGAMG